MKHILVNFNLITVFCEWVGLRLSPSQTEDSTWLPSDAVLKR